MSPAPRADLLRRHLHFLTGNLDSSPLTHEEILQHVTDPIVFLATSPVFSSSNRRVVTSIRRGPITIETNLYGNSVCQRLEIRPFDDKKCVGSDATEECAHVFDCFGGELGVALPAGEH
jgi:hypothetical protein